MTAVSTPTFIQTGGETAEQTRRSMGAILGLRGGIVGSGDLAVTQNGTPNMSVNVAGGQVVIPGTEATYQGYYICENRGTQNVSIAAADGTNPRRDLIVARIRDAGYSGATNSFAIEAVTGTPAASPADPATPANCWVLARVAVAAGASSITNANITDIRTGLASYTGQGGRASALGGIPPCTSSFRPTAGLYQGMVAYETDTDQVIVYNGSSWVEFGRVGAWTNYTPTLTQSGAVTKTVTYSRYFKHGRKVRFQAYLVVTGSGTGSNIVTVSVPFTAAQSALPVGQFYIFDASVPLVYITFAHLNTTTTIAGLVNGTNGLNLGQSSFTAGLASGDAVLVDVEYEATS